MSMEAQIQAMIDKFHGKMASDEKVRDEIAHLKKVFNLDMTTEVYSFRLEDSTITEFKPELSDAADVTMEASVENMQALMDGTLRPMKAYITKKVVIKGKIQDLMFLKKLF